MQVRWVLSTNRGYLVHLPPEKQIPQMNGELPCRTARGGPGFGIMLRANLDDIPSSTRALGSISLQSFT